jgi:hypothetical protein
VFQKRTMMDILFFAKVLRATVLGARKFILSIFLFLEKRRADGKCPVRKGFLLACAGAADTGQTQRGIFLRPL